MSHVEIDSFFSKFKFLCDSGYNATLKVKAVAGKASAILEAGPFPVPPRPFNLPHNHHVQRHVSPAQRRRRDRREAARRAAAVDQENQNVGQELEAEEVSNQATADEAATGEVVGAAEEVTTDDSATVIAEEAKAGIECELCGSKFQNLRGLRAHKGRLHKPISQLDGFGEIPNTECVYTFESTFAQEDVEYTLVEALSKDIETEIVSRQKVGDARSANHLYRVILSIPDENWKWPRMTGIQTDVIKKLEKVTSICC